MQFLLANFAEIVESIQARRIRVKLSIADQRSEGKKSIKYKEIGAPAKLVPAALFTAPALFTILCTIHHAARSCFLRCALFAFVLGFFHFILVIAFGFGFF